MCGESWLAIKDLQPTIPVLKAGHSVSDFCCLFVVCVRVCMLFVSFVCIVGGGFYFFLVLSVYMYFFG